MFPKSPSTIEEGQHFLLVKKRKLILVDVRTLSLHFPPSSLWKNDTSSGCLLQWSSQALLSCLQAFCLSWHHLLCCSNCLKTHKLKNFFSPQKIPRQPIESSKNMPERIPHPEQYLRSSCSCAYPTHCKLRRASLRQGPCPRVLPLLSTPWVCHLVGILVHGAKSFYCLRTDANLPGLQKSREK